MTIAHLSGKLQYCVAILYQNGTSNVLVYLLEIFEEAVASQGIVLVGALLSFLRRSKPYLLIQWLDG
jgi:hypothetical protein